MVRFLFLLLILLCRPAWAALEGTQEELSELRSRITQLRNELELAAGDRSEAADALRASEKRISDVNRTLRNLQLEERQLGADVARLTASTRETQTRLQEQEDRLASLLRAHYMYGSRAPAQLLLGGRNPGEINRALTYYAYIGRARADLIRQHRQTLAQLADLQQTTVERRTALEAVKSRQLVQRQFLEKQKTARKQVINTLSRQISHQRQEIDSLRRDELRLTRLIRELKRVASKSKTPRKQSGKAKETAAETVTRVADVSLAGIEFAKLRGKLALPVAGEIRSRFGQAREGGGPDWKGIFIRAASGQPVRAVSNGLVVFADWLRGFGNLLILDHGDGYLSLYSNNESLYKQTGDSVKAGDVVASVGSTGGQPEAGLYFELRHQGKPFDPMRWVR